MVDNRVVGGIDRLKVILLNNEILGRTFNIYFRIVLYM